MRVEVLTAQHGLADGEVLTGGSNDVVVTEENAPLLAGARAAGVLLVVEATPAEETLLAGHVQSQEDGEAAYAAAQESGAWHEGNEIQAELDEAARAEEVG